jgi:cell cycle arrest protein BUB3
MKAYPKYPTSVSALAFSPDGSKLAIGASYEHDNALSAEEQGRVMVLIKDTVMEDCRVGGVCPGSPVRRTLTSRS